jgi:hypothetical protein
MRYNDTRDGTNTIESVLERYTAAWASRQMIDQSGLIVGFVDDQTGWYAPAKRHWIFCLV